MPTTNIEGYKCERCNYKWAPRTKGIKPVTCPKCRSAYWDRPRKQAASCGGLP